MKQNTLSTHIRSIMPRQILLGIALSTAVVTASTAALNQHNHSGDSVTEQQLESETDVIKEEYGRSLSDITEAAKKGEVKAMKQLGDIYSYGDNGDINMTKAILWYEQAAKLGNVDAMIDLAQIYDEEGPKDKMQYWSGQAQNALKAKADKQDTDAMIRLARLYYEGLIVPEDTAKTETWYKQAAALGSTEAMLALGDMYDLYEPETQAQAITWYTTAAQAGNVDAMFNLAEAYSDSEFAGYHPQTSVDWYTKAAETGDIHAMYMLAMRYYDGELVPQNYAAAMSWYKRIAASHHADSTESSESTNSADAMSMVADMYRNGEGVAVNAGEALVWYKKAAQQKDMHAMASLADMYEKGEGVPIDKQHALNWYKAFVTAYYSDE